MLFYLIELILGLIGVVVIALLSMTWVAWQFREEEKEVPKATPEPQDQPTIQLEIIDEAHQSKLAGFD